MGAAETVGKQQERLWKADANHGIIESQNNNNHQIQPQPTHCAHCPRPSVPYLHSSKTPAGTLTPPPAGQRGIWSIGFWLWVIPSPLDLNKVSKSYCQSKGKANLLSRILLCGLHGFQSFPESDVSYADSCHGKFCLHRNFPFAARLQTDECKLFSLQLGRYFAVSVNTVNLLIFFFSFNNSLANQSVCSFSNNT